MELNALLTILDASDLDRSIVGLRNGDDRTVSYVNNTGESLSATVNGTSYSNIFNVCLVNKQDNVMVYLNRVTRFKLESIALESVSTFSIS